MSVKDTVTENTEKYFSTLSNFVEKTSGVLVKLPSGDRVAELYTTYATKGVDAQRTVAGRLLEAKVTLPSWASRDSKNAVAA